jgi:hypothetical protein
VDLALAQKLLVHPELSAGGADALHLAALHGENRIGGPLVTLDDAEFGAEHMVEHPQGGPRSQAFSSRRNQAKCTPQASSLLQDAGAERRR